MVVGEDRRCAAIGRPIEGARGRDARVGPLEKLVLACVGARGVGCEHEVFLVERGAAAMTSAKTVATTSATATCDIFMRTDYCGRSQECVLPSTNLLSRTTFSAVRADAELPVADEDGPSIVKRGAKARWKRVDPLFSVDVVEAGHVATRCASRATAHDRR